MSNHVFRKIVKPVRDVEVEFGLPEDCLTLKEVDLTCPCCDAPCKSIVDPWAYKSLRLIDQIKCAYCGGVFNLVDATPLPPGLVEEDGNVYGWFEFTASIPQARYHCVLRAE